MTTISFRHLLAFGLIIGGNLALLPTPSAAEIVIAQSNTNLAFGLNQAKNLARQAVEEANGGLGEYRAEGSMHSTAEESPYKMNSDGSYTFTFFGRHPDAVDFTYESEVTVSASGQTEIIYNGAIREDVDITDVSEVSIDLNQAKNLARQTAEEVNGGLGNYRAEGSMHNNPNESPFVENTDGSYTFTFKGRRPESLDFTYESQVNVSRDGQAEIIYNRSTATTPELSTEVVEPINVIDSIEMDQPLDTEFAPQSP